MLGLAIQAGGRFLRIDSVETTAAVPVEGNARLAARFARDPFAAGDEPLIQWVE